MNGRIGWMSAILALQIVLTAALLLWRDEPAEASRERLVEFDVGQVARLRIEDGDGAEVVLRRADAGWLLDASEAGAALPADGQKVEGLLTTLESLRAPWPVATSSRVRSRFEVAEDAFQRHVVLAPVDGEPLVELYLGTSPGYRRVHARVAGHDEVYSVDLANYQLPTAADEWLDKTLLQAEGRVSGVAREGAWQLVRHDGEWQLDDRPADAAASARLATGLEELQVTGRVADGAPLPPERAVLRVTDAEGEYRLSVFGEPDAETYQVRSNRRPGRFSLPAYLAEPLLVDRAGLEPEAATQS